MTPKYSRLREEAIINREEMDGKKVQKGERQRSWREGSAAGAQGTFSL